jgi:hypothetical protein
MFASFLHVNPLLQLLAQSSYFGSNHGSRQILSKGATNLPLAAGKKTCLQTQV